jgi:molecular chaperone GrpE
MGMPMQNDTHNDTEVNTEPETVNVPINDEPVNTDEGESMEEINAEIEKELEAVKDAVDLDLDPQAQLAADMMKWKETAMRAAADLENYRKRMSREKTEAIKFGNQRLIEDLLPVIDNFNMGMMAAEAEAGSMIYMGMKMVQAQMDGFLSGQGVITAETIVGSDFNPNIHDAMSQEESDEHEEGKIIRVMRKGYLLGDRLIRPANVVVSKKADEKVDEKTDTIEV